MTISQNLRTTPKKSGELEQGGQWAPPLPLIPKASWSLSSTALHGPAPCCRPPTWLSVPTYQQYTWWENVHPNPAQVPTVKWLHTVSWLNLMREKESEHLTDSHGSDPIGVTQRWENEMNVVTVVSVIGSVGKAGRRPCLIKVASLFILVGGFSPLFPAQVLNWLRNNAKVWGKWEVQITILLITSFNTEPHD